MTGEQRNGWLLLLAAACTILTLVMGVIYTNRRAVITERKFCELSANSVETERRKLAEYQKEPPQTAAGVAQRNAVANSLRDWEATQRALGCPR